MVPITEDILKELRDLRKKTFTEPGALLSDAKSLPLGLTVCKVENWLKGLLKTAQEDHLEFVIKEWKKLPQTRVHPFKTNHKPITPQILEHLKGLKKETGVDTCALLHGRNNEIPEGLNSAVINTWLRGKAKIAKREHLNYVIRLWEEIEHNKHRWVTVTKKQLEHFHHHRVRTGVEPSTLLRISATPPYKLDIKLLSRIITGNTRCVRENHLEYIIMAWEALSDRTVNNKITPLCRVQGRVKITEETHNKLKKYHDLNWLPGFIFKGAVDVPDGLSSWTISSWLSKASATAHKEHLEWVFARCRELTKNV